MRNREQKGPVEMLTLSTVLHLSPLPICHCWFVYDKVMISTATCQHQLRALSPPVWAFSLDPLPRRSSLSPSVDSSAERKIIQGSQPTPPRLVLTELYYLTKVVHKRDRGHAQ